MNLKQLNGKRGIDLIGNSTIYIEKPVIHT